MSRTAFGCITRSAPPENEIKPCEGGRDERPMGQNLPSPELRHVSTKRSSAQSRGTLCGLRARDADSPYNKLVRRFGRDKIDTIAGKETRTPPSDPMRAYSG